MGNGLCCCADTATITRERDASLPTKTYADWADATRKDFGRDLTAVSRDLPRMAIRVLPRLQDSARASPEPYGSSAAAAAAEPPKKRGRADDLAVLRERYDHLGAVLTQLVSMVGDDKTAAELRHSVPEAWHEIMGEASAKENPDASVPLRGLFKKTGLLPEAATEEQKRAAAGTATAAEEDERGAALVALVPPAYRLLLCFAQGIVFFAAQRMAFLLWMPWASRLRDQDWRVCAYDGENPPQPGEFGSLTSATGGRQHSDLSTHSDEPLVAKTRTAACTSQQPRPASYGSVESDHEKDGKKAPKKGGRAPAASLNDGGDAVAVNIDEREVLERCRLPGAPATPVAPDHNVVCVAHTQTSRNFTEGDGERPQFEVRWTMELVLDRATGNVLSVHLQSPAVSCEKPRGVCGPSPLYVARRRQLEERVFAAFGVDVADVECFRD